MTELVTLLSTGKDTWTDVIKLMNAESWEKIVIITNQFGADNIMKKENMELIVIDSGKQSLFEIRDSLKKQFDELLVGPEIALNMLSGSGKEHMAVISSLLKSGFGIRQIAFFNNQVNEV